MAHMGLHGAFGKNELMGDARHASPACKQEEDLGLPRGQTYGARECGG